MAFSKSLPKGQVPVGCQLCETGSIIKWRCEDCSLLICEICKKAHQKLAKDHRIVDIRSRQVPEKCEFCENEIRLNWKCDVCQLFLCNSCKDKHLVKAATKDHKVINIESGGESISLGAGNSQKSEQNDANFQKVKQYIVNASNIHSMAVCGDGSLWIGDNQFHKLQHITLSGDEVLTVSSFDMKLHDLAILSSGSPFIAEDGSVLMTVDKEEINTDLTNLTVYPWTISCVHVTREDNVVVGGHNQEGKGVVIVMEQDGNHLVKYQKYKDKRPFKLFKKSLFTRPVKIETTGNGNIFVSDSYKDNRRIVVIKQGCDDFDFYYGHADVNVDQSFQPTDMVVTSEDNVLVLERVILYLHVLNNDGDFITHCNLKDSGLIRPRSFALAPSGNIYVGCLGDNEGPKGPQTTICEIKFSGV